MIRLLGRVVRHQLVRRNDHHATGVQVDLRRHCPGEWQHHHAALGERDLDHVAGAEIVQRPDRSVHRTVRPHRPQTDKIGMVELVAVRLREPVPRRMQLDTGQRFGRVAVLDAVDMDAQEPAYAAQDAQRELPRAAGVGKR
ncbi:MAG: hypothetical protein OEY27_09535, partial [Gammaproteobacteria bacterium]|nr:hypothetical protein [Gammaproteobacteria bacterium]